MNSHTLSFFSRWLENSTEIVNDFPTRPIVRSGNWFKHMAEDR